MQNNDLANFIEESKKLGHSDQEIKSALAHAGWHENQYLSYFGAKPGLTVPTPPSDGNLSKPHHGSLWDTFQHVLMFIALYVYTVSLTALIHLLIEKWLPNVTEYSEFVTNPEYISGPVRMASSALIVSFPIFAYLFLSINRKTFANPALRQLSARKKLTYFTLTVTFIIGIIQIAQTIYSFLGGNTSVNFLAHFLVNIVMVSIIFIYYLNEVKEDRKHQ